MPRIQADCFHDKGDSAVCQFFVSQAPKNHAAREYISTNIIANILGLGWACTPAGLKAMEELQKLNEEECRKTGKSPHTASNEMCSFLILNISSLQLIPVSIIAYRSQYGSVNPTAVIMPGLIATLFSTIVGVIFIKVMDRGEEGERVILLKYFSGISEPLEFCPALPGETDISGGNPVQIA